jgi:hypothetical protein
MTDPTPPTSEATQAETVGERPDPDHTPDSLRNALTGSGMGSDTRAGSLQGGAATGSDDDPDQAAVDRVMRKQGRAMADASTGSPPKEQDADAVAPSKSEAGTATATG